MQLRAWDLRDDGSPRFSQGVRFSPLTADGIRIADNATVGFDVGASFGIGGEDNGVAVSTPIDRRGVHAEVNLKAIAGPVGTELRATHTMLPLFDGQVVQEDRIAGWAQLAAPGYTVRGEAFVGRNTVLRDAPGGASVIVAGGAADLAWAVLDRVHVIGRVELARSLAVLRATDPVMTEVDLRATIGINAHYDARWE